jgi:hypothetical protein
MPASDSHITAIAVGRAPGDERARFGDTERS